MIKNISIEDLRSEAVDIMNKTYLELGSNRGDYSQFFLYISGRPK